MIVPKLYGRLGNQCFQVAAAIAHARKMQTSWAIPRSTNDARIWPNYFLKQIPRQFITPFSTRKYYKELRHCYDTIPELDDLTIDGYFQSEKYWPDYDNKYAIGDALGFHCNWATQEANGNGYISVHVRRGDFVTDYADKHPALPPAYYDQAIAILCAKGYDDFKVYSDDIEYCKKMFQQIGWNVSYSKIKDPLIDMRDMYNASGFIIANSTFSLFPALLRLDNPIVIAPSESRWFGPGNSHLQTIDLMPERFIKI